MEIEQPARHAVLVAGGPLTGCGWLLAPEPIESVSIWLDGLWLCGAQCGQSRDDVAKAYPQHPQNGSAGFTFVTTLPQLSPGPADLRVVVRTPLRQAERTLPVEIARTQLLAEAEIAEPAGELSLDTVQLDRANVLQVTGRYHGEPVARTLAVRIGATPLGLADLLSDPGVDSVDAQSFRFDFRTRIHPALTAEPVTVVMHGLAGPVARTTGRVSLPSASLQVAAGVPPMMIQVDEAWVNDRGVISVGGWAISLSAITDIDIVLIYPDNREEYVGQAQRCISRPDVAADHPAYPDSDNAGYLVRLLLTDEQLGAEVVRVVARAVGGITHEVRLSISQATKVVRAVRTSTIHCFIDIASLAETGELSLVGWAVCESGVAAIEVALNDTILGVAKLGGHRPDIGTIFSEIPSAAQAGFRFAGNAAPSPSGEHMIHLTIRGCDGEERRVIQPVQVTPAEPGKPAAQGSPPAAIKYFLDLPAVANGRAIEPVRGFMALTGWAFARTGAVRIEVFIDGQSQGEAYRGIRREDLQAAFPDWEARLAGFSMLIPQSAIQAGEHAVRLEISDETGHTEEIGFTVEAGPAAEGPGPWQLRRKIPQAENDLQLAILSAASLRPLWALLLPMRRASASEMRRVRETLASLRHQAYDHWGIVVAAPPGVDPDALTATLLAGLDDLAPHIAIRQIPPQAPLADLIAGADLLTLLSPGDLLGEDALMELAVGIAVRPDSDFIYSDERRHDPADGQMRAFFKPDWSPDLLLSTNYIGRLWAVRRAPVERLALRFADLADGDYNLVLRLCEAAAHIGHVPKVLCERGRQDLDTPARQRRALQNAVRRRGLRASVLPGCLPGSWRVKRVPDASGLVSIIIPSIAARGLVEITISSIRAHTAWPDVEIVVLDNIYGTDDPDRLRWKRWLAEHADRVIEVDEAFNWSRFNNIGAAHARGEYLLFLNDDIEVRSDDWLHGLMEHAQRPEVGVVGPQLLYPDGRVQHAGVFLSATAGRHAFRFYPADAPGPFGLALTQRNVISVTGACMLMRRALFDELGGFDEHHAVINNDLDFALRAHALGRLAVYTPYVTLIHHEMASRAELRDVYDTDAFDAAWKDRFLQGDPYFHPRLSGDSDDYQPEAEPLRQFQVGHPLIARHRVRRILAVKVDHIGDFITAFPAFRRIRQHFPDAELCVLAARASLSLAELEPAIDRVIEFNFFHARSELGTLAEQQLRAELLELQIRLAAERFDIVIDLRRQTDTRCILPYTGARWLAGFDRNNASPWLDIAIEFEGDNARTFKPAHAANSLIHLVDAVAAACETDRSIVRYTLDQPAARTAARQLPALADAGADLFDRPVACVHTGAGAANKQWPAASFAGLIDLLAGGGAHVVIVGGPDEGAFAASVLVDVRRKDRVTSVVGQVSLRDLPVLLKASDIYVGNDSGPKHLAAAVGVPTIGIHSGSVDAGEWGPIGEATITIRRDMICGPCYIAHASDCPRGLVCLSGIKVAEVFQACQRLLVLRQAAGRIACG